MFIICLEPAPHLSNLINKLCTGAQIESLAEPNDASNFPDAPWFIDAKTDVLALASLFQDTPTPAAGSRYLVYQDSNEVTPFLGNPFDRNLRFIAQQDLPNLLTDLLSKDKSIQAPAPVILDAAIPYYSLHLTTYLMSRELGIQTPGGKNVYLRWLKDSLGVSRIALYRLTGDAYHLQGSCGLGSRRTLKKTLHEKSLLVRTIEEGQVCIALPSILSDMQPATATQQTLLKAMSMAGVLSIPAEDTLQDLVFFSGSEKGTPIPFHHVQEIRHLGMFLQTGTMDAAGKEKSGAANLEPLNQAETVLQLFASRCANEFKNTLVPIKTFTQLLPERYKDTHFRKDFFKVMTREVHRLEELVDTIGFFSSKRVPDPVSFEIVGWLSSLFDDMKNSYPKARFTLLPKDRTIDCEWDQLLITKAFKAIFKNALQSMDGAGTVTIHLLTSVDAPQNRLGNQISILIQDDGVCPDQAVLDKVFQPLFSTRPNGLGLGLTLAKLVIEGHGGNIQIEGRPSGGTEVSIHMPLQSTNSLKKLHLEGLVN